MIPLYVSCDIDFTWHMVPAAPEQTMREIAEIARSFVVDKRGRQPAGTVPRLRRPDAEDYLPQDATAAALGLAPTDWLHLGFAPT